MSEFKEYRRKQISELRPVTAEEIELGRLITAKTRTRKSVSVSDVDLQNGSPKEGDMIARNPKNHDDQWLVAKDYFEDNLEPFGGNDNLSFGLAIEALKQGKCVARKGWNGKGMFICKQVPARIGIDIVPKMQSLPEDAKKIFLSRYDTCVESGGNPPNNFSTIDYENQMLIVKGDNTMDSWVPSSSDVFAEDWFILE